MRDPRVWRTVRFSVALVFLAVGSMGAAGSAGAAADLNPKAINVQLPEECVLEIVGIGPATSTAAEEK